MDSKLRELKKTTLVTVGIFIMSLVAALVGSSGLAGGPEDSVGDITTQQQLSSKLIRLHVIANSDSPEDQDLKLKVRDAIIKTLDREFEDIDDINESREYIKNNIKDLEEVARREIKKSGKNYSATAMFGKFPFPVKTYGYATLPAGEYEALRIIIGSGKGANWWCVLFPPLCFVDITHGITEDEARSRMSKVLTAQEMTAIETAKTSGDIPVEIRFKVLDWWKEARGKIDRTIKLAFR